MDSGVWHDLRSQTNLAAPIDGDSCFREELGEVMKVKYIGTDDDQVKWGSNDDPRGLLKEGEAYEVSKVEARSWHTKIHLKDFPGKRFNSVSFTEAQ